MGSDELRLVVRKPVGEIEAEIRREYGVASPLLETHLDADAIVFTFSADHLKRKSSSHPNPPIDNPVDASESPRPSNRRTRRKARQRTKTRGWDVVAKFKNSDGLTCTIYKPFFEALSAGPLKHQESFSIVRKIMVQNGNNPKPASVEYFLQNTLEYIRSIKGGPT